MIYDPYLPNYNAAAHPPPPQDYDNDVKQINYLCR